MQQKPDEEWLFDYHTNERLLAPFILIALQGSGKKAIPINTSSLEYLADEIILDPAQRFDQIIQGENFYTIFSADADYTSPGPNVLQPNFKPIAIKGYSTQNEIAHWLPNVDKYFTDPSIPSYDPIEILKPKEQSKEPKKSKEPEPPVDDDIPF